MLRSHLNPAADPRPTFTAFRSLAASHGCAVHATSTGTWQIRGPHLAVDLDPEGWAPLFTVRGCRFVFVGRSPEDAILAALNAPPRLASTKRSRTFRRLFARARRCRWCLADLAPGEATVDHRVPLTRGGLNALGNLVPACARCNRFRGAAMPELGGAA